MWQSVPTLGPIAAGLVSGLAGLLLGACAGSSAPQSRGQLASAGAAASPVAEVVTSKPICAADNPFCAPTMATPSASPVSTAVPCGTVPIDLRPAGVHIMVAVSGAAHMSAYWPAIETTLRSLREKNPTASFGMQLLWADPLDLSMGQTTRNMNNHACGGTHNTSLDLGDHDSQALIDFLGARHPGRALRTRSTRSLRSSIRSTIISPTPRRSRIPRAPTTCS